MATKKVTITLPEELVEAAKGLTENLSGFAAEALAERVRQTLLAEESQRFQDEHGAFTDAELAAAERRLYGGVAGDHSAA